MSCTYTYTASRYPLKISQIRARENLNKALSRGFRRFGEDRELAIFFSFFLFLFLTIAYRQKSATIAGNVETVEVYFHRAIRIGQEVYAANDLVVGPRYIGERSTF